MLKINARESLRVCLFAAPSPCRRLSSLPSEKSPTSQHTTRSATLLSHRQRSELLLSTAVRRFVSNILKRSIKRPIGTGQLVNYSSPTRQTSLDNKQQANNKNTCSDRARVVETRASKAGAKKAWNHAWKSKCFFTV